MMADLPIELWHLIFDRLELVDLSSVALVSKAVYFAVKAYRVREIAFTRRVHRWFHYTTPINNHKHRIDLAKSSILKRSSFNFIYLKRLKIGRLSSIDLDVINRFVHLEELDIDLKNYRKENRALSLANLKVLYLFVYDNNQTNHLPYVELDTPRLAKVCTFNLEMLEFLYPESVRCIHTFFHSGKLSMFRNLEYLLFTDCYNLLDYLASYSSQTVFKEFSVTALKKLKEIGFQYYYSVYKNRNMSNFKRVTENLLALGRPNLKMFWFHVQMIDTSLLTEYERMKENVRSQVAFQLQHYELLKEKVEFFWSYNFNSSVRKLQQAGLNPRSEEVTLKLLVKYSFKRIVITGRVEERELLLELIAGSPDLFALEFVNSRLGQSFFDRMTDIVQLKSIPLQQFRLKGSSKDLKFEFIIRLRDLELFKTDLELPAILIIKLLKHPLLVEIGCSFGGTAKRIERLSTNRFRLNEETLNLPELLDRFEAQLDYTLIESKASMCRPM